MNLRAEDPAGQDVTRIEAVEPGAEGLTLAWTDGHRSFFHYLWLRDCCYCESCGDSYSSKRFLTPLDVPLDIAAQATQIDAQGDLEIIWRPDGHRPRRPFVSQLTSGWLYRTVGATNSPNGPNVGLTAGFDLYCAGRRRAAQGLPEA